MESTLAPPSAEGSKRRVVPPAFSQQPPARVQSANAAERDQIARSDLETSGSTSQLGYAESPIPVSSSPDDRWKSPNASISSSGAQRPPSDTVFPAPPVHTPPPPPKFLSALPTPLPDSAVWGSRNSPFFSEIPISPATAPPPDYAVNGESYGLPDHSASAFVLFSSESVLNEKKIMNTSSLRFGALVSPGRNLSPGPPTVRRSPIRCYNCGAYSNLYSSIVLSSGNWKCSLCGSMNSSEGEYRALSKDHLYNFAELSSPVVDYVDVSGSWRPGFVPVSDSAMAAPVILVIDECLDEPLLQHLQSSLHFFLDSLAQQTRIAIMTYGKTVSIYDLSETGLAAADVLPGHSSPSQELIKMLIYGTGVYLAPMHACLQIAHTIVSSLRPYCGELTERARERCMGTGVEVALALVQGPSTDLPRSTVKRSGGCSRILVCAGGPNTLGVGSLPTHDSHPNYAFIQAKALKHMEKLGSQARALDASVDVLCGGTCPVSCSILAPLAKASGGLILLHDDFGEAFGLNLQRSVRRAMGFRGVMEVRCSDGIVIDRVIGPGEEGSDGAADGGYRKDPAVSLQMLSLEESQGFATWMQLTKDLTADYVHFQFSVQYTSTLQASVTRVITVRLPVTNNVSRYLESMDAEVTGLLIGKKTALEAKSSGDALDMQVSVDERMKDIASRFGSGGKVRKFPKEVARLPEILLHLRRGPLLGSIVCHEDERLVVRNLFLQASYELASRMLLPRVLLYHDGGEFEDVPAYDLAMQSDTAIVLDHGIDVYIWMGLDLCGDEKRSTAAFAACKTLVQEITESRFPAPRMLTFREGSSQARYLQSRLIPAHKDPPFEQEARFPQLRSLNLEQRSKLKMKFLRTDEMSLNEWIRKLKLTLPNS